MNGLFGRVVRIKPTAHVVRKGLLIRTMTPNTPPNVHENC